MKIISAQDTPDLSACVIGIELGSTRIKAVLVGSDRRPLASGSFEWENRFENGYWTYSLSDAREGLRSCYAALKADLKEKYGVTLDRVGAIGVSGMMHGYLVFDRELRQIYPFVTWRSTVTAEESELLTGLLGIHIPQRWSAAHLLKAVRNGEEHLNRLSLLTTLSGYIHLLLTGHSVIGVGEASGMFPVDPETLDFDKEKAAIFDRETEKLGHPLHIRGLLPEVLPAGECGGFLSEDGARFLDPDGDLKAGIPFAPPESDAGTGMISTNTVRLRTGNISMGTSGFVLLVTDKKIGVNRRVDQLMTPAGLPTALVQCNNCTTDINSWIGIFSEFSALLGQNIDRDRLFSLLFEKALEGDPSCGGLISYNYFSGEHITDCAEGRPVFARPADRALTLADFWRTHLYSTLAAIRIGLDILKSEYGIEADTLCGHGGFFRTPRVGQLIVSAAAGVPVTVRESAGEGGPYGMALLAAYMLDRKNGSTVSLEDYLDEIFVPVPSSTLCAEQKDMQGFTEYVERYKKSLPIEQEAIKTMRG